MPPKRKRNDEAAAAASSTPATRSSARTSNSGAASTSKSANKKTKGENGDKLESESTRPAKKTKTTKPSTKTTASSTKTTKTTVAKKSTTSSSRTAEKNGAEEHTKSIKNVHSDDLIVQKNGIPEPTTPTTIHDPPPSPAIVQPLCTPNEPYSAKRAQALFKNYEDNDEPNTIGADGFSRLCNDADITMEGALALILAWQFGTEEMMKITAEEWRKGTESLKVSNLLALNLVARDLEDLLILEKPMPSKKSKKDFYDKTAYWKYSKDRKASFNQLYTFCFNLVKPAQSKNIDMETATALWSVLLVPKYPLMGEVVGFIGDNPTAYRAANKDLWSMMLEFCETINPNLSDYETDAAWPTLLDNFVAWKKGQSVNGTTSA